MKDQNEITDLIAEFRKEESTLPDNGARFFSEESDLELQRLLQQEEIDDERIIRHHA